jgi:hypothetical protein
MAFGLSPVTRTIYWLAISLFLGSAFADDADKKSAVIMPAEWQYSTDGGKTFSAESPKIGGTHTVTKRADAARATFTIEDPTKIGLLKVAMKSGIGGFAITNAASVDRYNVGTCPTLLNTKITLNGQETKAGHLPFTLYDSLAIDPNLLKRGANTLKLDGNLWHKNYAQGEVSAGMHLEVIPANRAVLDRLPVLGIVAEDYFGLAARAEIPSTFTVAVTPVEPNGQTAKHQFSRSRVLKARVPLKRGTRKFRYTVAVHAGDVSKQYGPYETRVPIGNDIRFMAAGGTLFRGDESRIQHLFSTINELKPDVFIHTGNYQNCPAWDFMWTNEFLRVSQPTFCQIPLFPMTNAMDMISPVSLSQTFFFPPNDKDWGHWTVVIGNVRFVTIEAFNQSQDKTDSGVKWLENVLKTADEDFVLVLNGHASHCSPINYNKMFRAGANHTVAKINPLLVKYKVTATIGSIHRCYERVEPPADESVPTILTGHAGGLGWHTRTDPKNPNRHSKVLTSSDHYCVFEVTPAGLEMKAIDFAGKTLDTRTFKARRVKTK